MVGGLGAASAFRWVAFGGVGYEINDRFSVVGGYRGLGVDCDRHGFLFNVVEHGPVVSSELRF